MRKQIKAALVGMVLAGVVFFGTPAKGQLSQCTDGGCANGFNTLDISCRLYGCTLDMCGEVPCGWANDCTYYCTRMSNVVPPGMEICDTRGESSKPTEPTDSRNSPVTNSRSDSK